MYNLLIYTYSFGIRLASFFNTKAMFWVEGRKRWDIKLKEIVGNDKNWIWFHCASLGEFEDGRVIIDRTRKRFPGYKILITFFSPSGFNAKKNYMYADAVVYLPIDTSYNANLFVDILKPGLAIFVHNDIWINYLKGLKKKNTPIILLTFSLNNGSSLIRWPNYYFYKKAFSYFDKIFTHNIQTANIINQLFEIRNTFVTGNLRVNSIYETFNGNNTLDDINRFVSNDFCIVAGSSLLKDQQLFIDAYYQTQDKKIKWIIVPHEINIRSIKPIVLKNKKMLLYSEIKNMNTEHDFLWIDNVGMLSKIYKYADIAFIGGGFNRIGIHNILEPAVFGCPVAFGPNHRNYPEAIELLEKEGAEVVKNKLELKRFLLKFYGDKTLLVQSKKNNSEYVFNKIGDPQPVFNEFDKFLARK